MRQTDNNRTPADIASGQKTRRKNYSASTLRALAKKNCEETLSRLLVPQKYYVTA
jgi:hypothetical protein